MAQNPYQNQSNQIDKFQPKSSFLETVEYDRKSLTLTITFKNGNSYKHLYVFPGTYDTFKQSPDHSVFYSKVIKSKHVSVPLRKQNVGRAVKSGLKQPKQRRNPLNAGLRDSYIYRNIKPASPRVPGTVPNALRRNS